MAADGCWGGRVLFFGGLVTGIFLCYPCTHRQHRLYTRGLTQIHLIGYHEDRRLMCFWGNNLGEIRQESSVAIPHLCNVFVLSILSCQVLVN